MRLKEATIRHFRGVDSLSVSFDEGITIVEGPNESGKSSLVEALRMLREVKATSNTAQVRAIRPTHRDEAPEASLEMTAGSYHLRIHKVWGRGARARTELQVFQPQRESLTGDEAHSRFSEILSETVDVDMLAALDVLQGSALEQVDFIELAALHKALDAGGESLDDDHDALLQRIEAEYLRYFTPGGNEAKSVKELVREHDEQLRMVTDLEDRFSAGEALVRRQEKLAASIVQLDHRVEQASKEAAAAREEVAHIAVLHQAHQQAVQTLERAREAYQRCDRECSARTELVERLAQETAAASSIRNEFDRSREDENAQLSLLREKESLYEQAKTELTTVRANLAALDRTVARLRAQEERDRLQTRLEIIRRSDSEIAAHDATIETCLATPELVAQARQARTDLDVVQRTREAASPRLRVSALGDTPVLIDGEPIEAEYHGAIVDSLVLEAPGVVRAVVTAGTSLDTLDTAVDDARAALATVLAQGGEESVEALEAALAAKERAIMERTAAKERIETALNGESRAALMQQLDDALDEDKDAGLDMTLSECLNQREILLAEEMQKLSTVDLLADDVSVINRQVSELREKRVRLEEQLAAAVTRRDSADTELTAARQVRSDEDLRATRDSLAADLAQARTALSQAEHNLASADAETKEMLAANAEDIVRRGVREREEARADLYRVEGELRQVVDNGVADRLADAEARAHALGQRLALTRKRAAAVRRLREEMTSARDRARARSVAPFLDRLRSLGQAVFGSDFDVTVNESLQVESRELHGVNVPFADLSVGAKEQLLVLERLAVASLVDVDDGAPLILDDALGFADPDRLRTIGAVLSRAGQGTQIIILTCQPERFASVGNATVVKLEDS